MWRAGNVNPPMDRVDTANIRGLTSPARRKQPQSNPREVYPADIPIDAFGRTTMKYRKISGALLTAFEDLQEAGPTALALHTRTLGMAPVLGTQKPPRAIVFIHCDDTANLDSMSDGGLIMNQRRGRVRTALLPLDMLGELSDSAKVKHIVASRLMKPCMDKALAKVKVPAFRSTSGLSGDGVIVGVVDTGIDPNHPDFAGRILRIWDQTVSGPGVAEGSFGLELTGPLIAASRDTDGHGTHVAGIAAGAGTKFSGVAPKANYVIVKTSFQDAHIADGIRYIFRVAEELGRPAVVNLSLGGHFDPHDGTDSLCQIIDDETGPGKIVVCAAGNEGSDDIHARLKLGAPATRKLKFFVPGGVVSTATLNGWYPGTGKLEISVTSPAGLSTPFQAVIATGNFQKSRTLGGVRVITQTPPKDLENNDHNFTVEIRQGSGGTPLPTGNWELRVRNTVSISGNLDVWTLDDQISPTVVFRGTGVSDSHKIGSPGSSLNAVTVGAFVTRNKWKDINGVVEEVEMDLNKPADFSSEGPLRNETEKPDVTAPGAMIVSCLSADSDPDVSTILDAGHFAEAGTSMACPFVSGIVALLLERNPAMTPTDVKAALKTASRIPGKTAGTFDRKWGFGLLDGARL